VNDNKKQVIEINGVKMEIDTRHAVRIDTFRIGTKVKLLEKETGYSGSSNTKVYSGVIVGFEPFASLPTIVVCYLDRDYSGANLKFAYVNTASDKKWEIVASVDDDLPVQRADVLTMMDRDIAKKQDEIAEIERKRSYFIQHFAAYFEPVPA
jgi:hypothetical protein